MRTVTIKLDDILKKKMSAVTINWSEYIILAICGQGGEGRKERSSGQTIRWPSTRIPPRSPKGFVNETIRKTREER